MLLSAAWRNVKNEWRKEVHENSTLSMMRLIWECEVELSCAWLKSKAEKRMMFKFRGGTAAFQIEMGRWHWIIHAIKQSVTPYINIDPSFFFTWYSSVSCISHGA